MLRIREHIAKQLAWTLRLATRRDRVGEQLDAGCKGLCRGGREGAPGVEFAVGPVGVGGPDGPAAKDTVRTVDERPVGEEGARGVGELAVANVALVRKGVELADELIGAEVGGLEEAWVRCLVSRSRSWGIFSEEQDEPHCVQYCHAHEILAGSVNRRSRSQVAVTFTLPEQFVSRY